MLRNYKTLIFDLGGVIINLNEKATIEAFRKLSSLSDAEFYQLYKPTSYSFTTLEDFETGKLSMPDFRNCMREILKIKATDDQIDHAWNQILGDIPQIRIDLLKKLVQTHQLILLSNTNEIHCNEFEQIFSKQSGMKNFAALFHHVYYSFQMNDRKPNLSIYRKLVENHQLNPAKTLFIDDNMKNAIASKKVGIHTIHLVPPMTIEQLFV
jgi:putative hydrolase of the HAD superfamily